MAANHMRVVPDNFPAPPMFNVLGWALPSRLYMTLLMWAQMGAED
jgi:hypothetical protein